MRGAYPMCCLILPIAFNHNRLGTSTRILKKRRHPRSNGIVEYQLKNKRIKFHHFVYCLNQRRQSAFAGIH